MKYKLLTIAMLCCLGNGAIAQDRSGSFDDRWYISAGAGANIQDSDRDTELVSYSAVPDLVSVPKSLSGF